MSLSRRLAFSILLLMSLSSGSRASLRCEEILKSTNFRQLITNQIEELAQLKINLELAKAAGDTSLAFAALEHNFSQKESLLNTELQKNQTMTPKELKIQLKAAIIRLQDQKSKEEQRKENDIKKIKDEIDIATQEKMVFQPITPGSYIRASDQKKIEITAPFDMMATQVTQLMWAKVMFYFKETRFKEFNGALEQDVAPSFSRKGPDSIVFARIHDIDVRIRPGNPVENINWYQANNLPAVLNQLSESTNPEDQKFMRELIPDHMQGDIYALPTVKQREFVTTNRGQSQKKYFDRDDEGEILKHAWLEENSKGVVQKVAQLQPRIIDGKRFYDLEGNLQEWTADEDHALVRRRGSYYMVFSSNSTEKVGDMHSNRSESKNGPNRDPLIGLRLVRISQ